VKAILLAKDNEQFSARVADVDESQLPEGDVTLRVDYSTINYKDALAITNKSPIVRKWPMVAGIDAAGTVEKSAHADFKPGDRAILMGWGVGESHWGGLAQKVRVKGDWLVKLPKDITPREAMAIGTAGFTAMLCIMALEDRAITAKSGEILVTGATGGVGSIAVAILAHRGYRVVASTGKASEEPYLKALGAAEVIDRNTLSQPGKPLQKQRWAGTVDSVGSHTLANACAQTLDEGVVTACGLAQGMDFPVTVAPFILRGVKLDGINSVTCPMDRRRRAWQHLEKELDRAKLASMIVEIPLGEAIARAPDVIAGKHRGRIVVDVNR
jgi:putative YhdH/YhfP family quinone oxidoreductase